MREIYIIETSKEKQYMKPMWRCAHVSGPVEFLHWYKVHMEEAKESEDVHQYPLQFTIETDLAFTAG